MRTTIWYTSIILLFFNFFFGLSNVNAEEISSVVQIKVSLKDKPVVVILPHQDDELFMAGTIQQYIKAGRKVFVVMVSDGSASSVRAMLNGRDDAGNKIFCDVHGRYHHPAKEGYLSLAKQRFSAARNQEFIQSVRILGIPRQRIFFMNPGNEKGSKKPIYRDGELLTSGQTIITQIFEKYGDGTYLTVAGGHHDHIALEEALTNFSAISEKLFFPFDTEGLTQATVLSAEELTKKQKAVRTYQHWQPQKGMFSIGGHSVPDLIEMWRTQDKEYYYSLPT